MFIIEGNTKITSYEDCHQKPGVGGYCKADGRMWSLEKGACKQFYYGGCCGNLNNFRTKKECEDVCRVKDRCENAKHRGTNPNDLLTHCMIFI